MTFQLSDAGGINPHLARKVHRWWREATKKHNVNLEGFHPEAPFDQRIAWALQCGLLIGLIYARFSSKRQHSTEDQIRECVIWAAMHGIYIPPELICVDEAIKGKRVRRDGLERMQRILQSRSASVLLVFKASRLFRL